MSFKLQDTIQKIKGMPGKYKRVLLAAASHARKDGTNIYASKETLGHGAGVSRWTAYRNIDPLVEKNILVEADTHQCANPNCAKGSKHSTGRGNHWTQVYNIDLVALQNATWESKKSRSKTQQSGVAKCLTSGVAKCDANRGIREARFTGSVEPSVLTDGSKKASEQVSLATTSLASPASVPASQESQNLPESGSISEEQNQKQNQPQEQPLYPHTREEMYSGDLGEEAYYATDLLHRISPNVTDAMVKEQLPLCSRILKFFDRVPEKHYRVMSAEMVLQWNRVHRSGKYASKDDKKLYIRTAAQFLRALESDSASLMNDYDEHQFDQCELCKAAGTMHYRKMVEEIRAEEKHQEAQKKAEAARKKEQERLAKLCGRCHKVPFGSMSLVDSFDDLKRPVTIKVCNDCYDKQYEWLLSGKAGLRANIIDKRPGYVTKAEKAAAEAKAAQTKALEDNEIDVPICLQCGQVTHAPSCPTRQPKIKEATA